MSQQACWTKLAPRAVRTARFVPILLVLPALAAPGLAQTEAGSTSDATLKKQVLQDVRKAYNKQKRPMVIFDLDGTLFDNRPRILQILKEYGEEELKGVRDKAAKKLINLDISNVRYMLTDTLKAIGIKESAIINNAAVFWSKRFFSDEYLKYDEPTAGAVDFVRKLYSNGARIVYLTGRDAPRQLIGTVKALRDNGFPIGIQGTELIMKPTRQTQDAVFKQQVTRYLDHYGQVIAAFDNEPANVNVYQRGFADALVIKFAAPHSPNPPPLLDGIKSMDSLQ